MCSVERSIDPVSYIVRRTLKAQKNT